MAVVLEQDGVDCLRVKRGPLHVYPPPYVNTTDVNREYVALVGDDDEFIPDVSTSHLGPFWTVGPGPTRPSPFGPTEYGQAQLWDARTILPVGNTNSYTYRRPFPDTFFPDGAGGVNQVVLQMLVDGNGYLYYCGRASFDFKLRRIDRNGNPTDVVIPASSLVPANDPDGNLIPSPIITPEGASPQEDGILLSVRVRYGEPPFTEFYRVAVVDSDFLVASSHWCPKEPVSNSYLFPQFRAALPSGYFARPLGLGGRFCKVSSAGAITATGDFVATAGLGAVGNWFHADGSYWARGAGGVIKYYDPSFNEIASPIPGIVGPAGGIPDASFCVTPNPPSNDPDSKFRFLHFDNVNGYRVFSSNGTLLMQKEHSGNFATENSTAPGFSYGGWFASNAAAGTQHCSGNRFLFSRLTAGGHVHKVAADSLICSPSLGFMPASVDGAGFSGVHMFPRGQYAHFSYSAWPVMDCPCDD